MSDLLVSSILSRGTDSEVTDVEVNAIAKALGVPINWLFGEDI